ncbi:glycerate kinase [Planoprotostelium fungivorum]|uniref:Glycerate kinase n=1 Tax=Planoprotostelium fungivorum TaxID=1890364 RepID=A0A2P6N144_9EUKA|nr:glycerate kinase [Planoprotostelium fungivorum]
MTTVLGAFDKFKGTLTSLEAGDTCTRCFCDLFGFHRARVVELSDGGDGFLSSLTRMLRLKIYRATVTGPLGTPVEAQYGIGTLPDGETVGVVEMASASGLHLLQLHERHPLYTTTKGTGELMRLVIDRGCKKIFLGVGGSATNDAGLGALQALGVEVTVEREGKRETLDVVRGIDLQHIVDLHVKNDDLRDVRVEISCDVTSPFVGPQGAVAVFSAQKGATEADKITLEKGMIHLADLVREKFHRNIAEMPGAGAAGGIAGGFHGILDAQLRRGIEFMAEASDLEAAVRDSDLILTGEGCYDSTSDIGKAPSKVLELARKWKKPAIIICGRNESVSREFPVYSLVPSFSFEEACVDAKKCLNEIISMNERSISDYLQRERVKNEI